MTHDVTAEGQWYDPDTGECGPTYPYTDSLITAQRILSGDRVSRGRSDIEAEFATHRRPRRPSPSATTASSSSPPPKRSPTRSTATPSAAPCPPAPASSSPPTSRVRDAMISAALDHPQAAAELWTHIARRLRGQPRAEALTIAAVCYCLLGDAIRAGIATDTALDEAQATDTPRRA